MDERDARLQQPPYVAAGEPAAGAGAGGQGDVRSVDGHTWQPELTVQERGHLERCVELAEQALAAGGEPFGSVLVSADGRRLCEGRNRVVETGDRTSTRSWAGSMGGAAPVAAGTGSRDGVHLR